MVTHTHTHRYRRRSPHTHTHSKHLLIAVRTDARRLVVFGTVVVRTVVEGAVPLANRAPPTLVHEVPVEADERPVLVAFVLQKRLALLDTELLQVSEKREQQ